MHSAVSYPLKSVTAIPVWLKDPHQWREGTKMPTFRLDENEIRAISAFIWQSGLKAELPQQKKDEATDVITGTVQKLTATEVKYQEGETFLETARRAGLRAPFSCESGSCATCMARLEVGEAKMRVNNALPEPW